MNGFLLQTGPNRFHIQSKYECMAIDKKIINTVFNNVLVRYPLRFDTHLTSEVRIKLTKSNAHSRILFSMSKIGCRFTRQDALEFVCARARQLCLVVNN